jgi:hypothetical protein
MQKRHRACASASRAHHIFIARNSFLNFVAIGEQSFSQIPAMTLALS